MRIPFTDIHIERRSSLANPSQWLIDMFSGGAGSASGIKVTEESAMQASAVYACVKVLAETIASLPLPLYRELPRGKEKATDHPLYRVLHDNPNPQMTSVEFRKCMMGHLALRGNAYAEKVFDGSLKIRQLWPLHPDRMQVIRQNGQLIYRYTRQDGVVIDFPEEKMLHLRGLSTDGIIGISPIRQAAKEAVGLALAAEQFGARLFSNGAKPSGVFKLPPGKTLKEESFNRLKADLQKQYTGLDNANRIMLLEDGLDYAQISISPEDAQFLELRKFQRNDIASIFRVPPHMIGDLERATFSNIEQQSLEFVTYTILPWTTNWEQRLNMSLLRPEEKEKYFFKFNLNGLLRGDFKTRMEGYAVGRQNGWLSVNDIRELEEMNPVDDGDVYLVNGNMIPANMAGKQQAVQETPRPDEGRSFPEARTAGVRKGIANSYKRVFADAVTRVLKREEADIMRQARKVLGSRDLTLFDTWLSDFYQEHEEFVRKTMEPAFVAYAEAVQAAAAEEAGGQAGMSRELEQFIDEYMANYIWRHSGVSIVELREALEKAVSEGLDQLETLQQTFDSWREVRPQEVAQEETIRMGGAVALLAWAANGIAKVRWVAVGSSCPLCRSLNGKVVDINTPFMSMRAGGDRKHPPLHKGCDCFLAAERGAQNQPSNVDALPGHEKAIIPEKKFVEHYLNMDSPTGKNKAIAFKKALGYDQSNYHELIQQIREKLPFNNAIIKAKDEFGERYQVELELNGPNGKQAKVKTGWIILNSEDTPRLTAAYVAKRKVKKE